MINIFGHNASSAYDNLLPDVTDLHNFEHYHLLLSNVCDAGNIFNATPTVSDDFVFADGKGAIGFLSPVDFPAEYGLKTFTDGIITLIALDKSANPDKKALEAGKKGINPQLTKFEVYEPKEFQEEKYRKQFAFV